MGPFRTTSICLATTSHLVVAIGDLSDAELQEAWQTGSLGAARVDRAGFERVWREVMDLFEGDIMDEARDPNAAAVRAGGTAEPVVAAETFSPPMPPQMTPEQIKAMQQSITQMSDADMEKMLDQMMNMGPAEMEQMKKMGIDPSMMKR